MSSGAIAAIVFTVVALLLLVYSITYNAKRAAAVEQQLLVAGYEKIEAPEPDALVPELLFYPNGIEIDTGREQQTSGLWVDMRARVDRAHRGQLAGRPITLMDVSVRRQRSSGGVLPEKGGDMTTELRRTVIRCDAPGPLSPPDLLIEETPMFKSQARGQRAIGGPELIGDHYFLYSTATDAELEPWITPALREALGRVRLWTIAVHDGVVYLTYSNTQVRTQDLSTFLQDGEALLSAFARAPS